MQVNKTTPLIRPHGDDEIKYPVYLSDLRKAFPKISFGNKQSDETLLPYGYYPVYDSVVPVGDVIEETDPIRVDGRYYRAYTVRPYNEEERAERLVVLKKDALLALKEQEAAIQYRFCTVKIKGKSVMLPLSTEYMNYLLRLQMYYLLNKDTKEFTINDAKNGRHVIKPDVLEKVYSAMVDEEMRLKNAVIDAATAVMNAKTIEELPTTFILPD